MSKNKLSAYQRANPPLIDRRLSPSLIDKILLRLEGWLTQRRRWSRAVIAALVSSCVTLAAAFLVFNALLQSATVSPNVVPITLVALAACGLVSYWFGWRLLIGFDFGAQPLQPGRRAAMWVALGIIIGVCLLLTALLSLIQALGPA